jgi:hypothetical protein
LKLKHIRLKKYYLQYTKFVDSIAEPCYPRASLIFLLSYNSPTAAADIVDHPSTHGVM